MASVIAYMLVRGFLTLCAKRRYCDFDDGEIHT